MIKQLLSRLALALTMAAAVASATPMVVMNGARYFASSGGGGAPDALYDFIDNPVGYTDHWVDPEKTTNGAAGCPEVDPCQPSQMFAYSIAGGCHRFIWLPGQLSVTGVRAGDSKMPYLQPTSTGTEACPVLVTTQYKATNSATTTEQLTVIRRTANVGSVLGTEGCCDHWWFDGFKMEGGTGSAGSDGGNEKALVVIRSADGWRFTRMWFDGEQLDWTSLGSTNGGAFFIQVTADMIIRDVLIEDIGDPNQGSDIWHGVELYDSTDFELSYFTIRNVFGLCIHMKGAPAIAFQRNRIHHGEVQNCNETGISAFDVIAGATVANHNYWWNIIVRDSGHGMIFNSNGTHQGTHLQNLTFVNNDEAIMFTNGASNGYTADISLRNNVVYDSGVALMWLDGFYDDDPDFAYNRYNTYATFMNSAAGNTSLSTWQSVTFNVSDPNSDGSAPSFRNAGGGDYVTASGAAADRPDTHDLYDDANVRPGAWEDVGPRTNL